MAKKDKELKEETEFRIKDYRSDIDKYVKEKVSEESKKSINIKDYKDQIDKYVKERVEIESASQSVKLLKKQLHSKKVSSCIKSFIILCLLGCIGYGVYYLYDDGYFDKDKKDKVTQNCSNQDIVKDDKVDTDPDKKEKDQVEPLEKLKNKYSYLLDNVVFDANSNYTRDYYEGNLTNEIKLYLSYKLMDGSKIVSDDDTSYFESSDLLKAGSRLFGNTVELTNFKYNNSSYIYFEVKDMFVSSTKPNQEKNISREIIAIDEDGDKVTITCVEGVVNGDKLYNILTNKEVYNYKSTNSLQKYESKLNVIKYVFEDGYLVSLEK